MREVIKAKIDTKCEFSYKKFRTWAWSDPSMLKILDNLRSDPEKYGKVIWATRRKKVYRLILPDGTSVAYKTGCPNKKFRYMFVQSSGLREMINYRIFRNAFNIPLVQLLAGGEVKRGPILQNAWIMTRFAEGYEDGRVLATADAQTRKDFLAFNIPLIAKLHKAGCYHRAFRPYNILMKRKEDGSLDCLWLDVASCYFYFLPAIFLRRAFLDDLIQFFKVFAPTADELQFAMDLYAQGNPRIGLTAEKLTARISRKLQ